MVSLRKSQNHTPFQYKLEIKEMTQHYNDLKALEFKSQLLQIQLDYDYNWSIAHIVENLYLLVSSLTNEQIVQTMIFSSKVRTKMITTTESYGLEISMSIDWE